MFFVLLSARFMVAASLTSTCIAMRCFALGVAPRALVMMRGTAAKAPASTRNISLRFMGSLLLTMMSLGRGRRIVSRLFCSLPDDDRIGAILRRIGNAVAELVAREDEDAPLLGAFPIREERVIDLEEDRLVGLIDDIPSPMRIASEHGGSVLVCRAFRSVIRRKFRPVGGAELHRITAAGVEDEHALRIGTHQRVLAAVRSHIVHCYGGPRAEQR